MQERRDSGDKGCRKEDIQEMRDVHRKGEIQDMRNAGNEGFRESGMQERRDSGDQGCRKGGI